MNASRRRITRKPRPRAATAVVPEDEARMVRLPRVRTALKRIETGFYDRDEVRERLAAVVLKELQKL
jgi:hypothetical protein